MPKNFTDLANLIEIVEVSAEDIALYAKDLKKIETALRVAEDIPSADIINFSAILRRHLASICASIQEAAERITKELI